MKHNLLRTVLSAAALLSATAFAHAAGPFIAGSQWIGFRVSTVGGGSSNASLNVSNNPNTGILNLTGQNVPVSISCTATGVVDLQGLGVPFAGIHVHGTVAPQGGTYSLTSTYVTNNDRGRMNLLRAYKSVTGGQIIIGNTAGTGLFPPGPCFGSFMNAAGYSGQMYLMHNLPREVGEANPPTKFFGDIYLQDFHFLVVGTINPQANADGSHSIETIGENVDPSSIQPCIRTVGMLVPAVQTNPTSIFGNYELIGLLRTGDMGSFQLRQ